MTNAELGGAPARATPTKTKAGPRLFPPNTPRVWPVGERLGAALRKALATEASAAHGGDGRASPRPHVRRAHWHKFWRGPRDGARHTELHWLPPIAVAVDFSDDLPTTIHEVKP